MGDFGKLLQTAAVGRPFLALPGTQQCSISPNSLSVFTCSLLVEIRIQAGAGEAVYHPKSIQIPHLGRSLHFGKAVV